MPNENGHIAEMLLPAHETLAANIRKLMKHHGISSDQKMADRAKIDQKTVWRILNDDQATTSLKKISAIAGSFGLETWQLLIPGLDPTNPPVFVMSSVERNLYERMKKNLQEMVANEPAHTYIVGSAKSPPPDSADRRNTKRREDDL